ncbi:MAG: hypothetical protein DYG89_07785 [Caldilinea sp. CFX5]|nr:hypothetical protein [Caldilinea sp. CFX5]
MAAQISEREVVGVRLLTLELSEGELEVLTSCVNYVLGHVEHKTLERLTGAYPDEVTAIRDDLRQLLQEESYQPIAEELSQEPV